MVEDQSWDDFNARLTARDSLPGFDAWRFLRRFDFAIVVTVGNYAEAIRLLKFLTDPENAKNIFKFRDRMAEEAAFLNASRSIHNVLSATYALTQILDRNLGRRERADTRWTTIRELLDDFRRQAGTKVILALRNYAIHVDTIDTGYTRTITADSDHWEIHFPRVELSPRDLGEPALTYYKSLPENIEIISFLQINLDSIRELKDKVRSAVVASFESELKELIAYEAELRNEFPRYFE